MKWQSIHIGSCQGLAFGPVAFIALARVAMQTNKKDEARKYLQSALDIKPDFIDALFSLSQVEVQAGNLKEAILKTEQIAAISLIISEFSSSWDYCNIKIIILTRPERLLREPSA